MAGTGITRPARFYVFTRYFATTYWNGAKS